MLSNIPPRLGGRLLLVALAVMLVGSFNQAVNQARANNRKPPAKPFRPSSNNKPAVNPPAPVQHNNHTAIHALVLPKPHPEAHKHPPVLAALRHLEEAFAILAVHANPLIGVRRIAAMECIELAYAHLNFGIGGTPGINQAELVSLRGLPPGNDFPHIRTALGKIRETQDELKKVAPNMHGHRRAAIVALNFAVFQLDAGMHNARSYIK